MVSYCDKHVSSTTNSKKTKLTLWSHTVHSKLALLPEVWFSARLLVAQRADVIYYGQLNAKGVAYLKWLDQKVVLSASKTDLVMKLVAAFPYQHAHRSACVGWRST